jgi:DNA-binding NtrC family response regulator
VKRVLFVDDEPNLLDALRRMLSPMRKQWEMEFVSSGREALRHLSETEYDVLVTDVRMPEVSGIELLTEALRFYPQVVRIVLSGTADQGLTLRSIPLAHQYLMKPCSTAVLRATIENALTLGIF